MHHVLPIYFKTIFGFQLNLSSKLPHLVEKASLLLVEKVPSLTKASLFQMEKCSKTLSISFLFKMKATLTLFSTRFISKAIYEMI